MEPKEDFQIMVFGGEQGSGLVAAAKDEMFKAVKKQAIQETTFLLQEKMQLQIDIDARQSRIIYLDAKLAAIERGAVKLDVVKRKLLFPSDLPPCPEGFTP